MFPYFLVFYVLKTDRNQNLWYILKRSNKFNNCFLFFSCEDFFQNSHEMYTSFNPLKCYYNLFSLIVSVIRLCFDYMTVLTNKIGLKHFRYGLILFVCWLRSLKFFACFRCFDLPGFVSEIFWLLLSHEAFRCSKLSGILRLFLST